MNNTKINQYLQDLINSRQSYSDVFNHLENNKLSLYFVLNEKKFSSSIINSKDYGNFKKRVIYKKKRRDRTFKLIEKLNSYDIMLLKIFRNIPTLNKDIDILVKNKKYIKTIQNILISNGYVQKKASKFLFWDNCNEPYKQIWIHKNNRMNIIHLHQELSWGGVKYFNKKELFERPDKIKIANNTYLIPNKHYDYLIHICHIMYEKNKIIFLERIYLDNLKKNLDQKALFSIAEQNNFSFALELFQALHCIKEYPYTIKENDFLALRYRKFLHDFLGFNPKQNFFELRSYTIDFISFFVFKRLRNWV